MQRIIRRNLFCFILQHARFAEKLFIRISRVPFLDSTRFPSNHYNIALHDAPARLLPLVIAKVADHVTDEFRLLSVLWFQEIATKTNAQ